MADDFSYFTKRAALWIGKRVYILKAWSVQSKIFKRGRADYREKNIGLKTCVIVAPVNNTGNGPDEN
jgi:hypothetical protein